jgi:carboxyl-terminal processing protease
MMRAFPHVTQVGGRTRGGLSSLLPKPFPNGFLVTLSYQRVLDADGTLFEGIGIPADRPLELFPDGDLRGGFASALSVLAEGR